MLDADYFRTVLPRDVEATGGAPVMEILLRNGHVHRVRSVVSVSDGWVTLEVYQMKGDLSHERPRFGSGETTLERVRAVVPYESISGVVLDPSPAQVKARPGFGFATS
jgi:hypothetical protein